MSGNNFGDSGVDGSVQMSVKVLTVFVRLRIGTGTSRPTGLYVTTRVSVRNLSEYQTDWGLGWRSG